MAVETVKSTLITARDATPPVPKLTELAGGPLKRIFQKVTVAASASSASRYVFFQLPSNAAVSQLKLMCTTTGSAATMDFGIWETTGDGASVVYQALFASAQAISSPILESTYNNIVSETGSNAFTDFEKPLWELAGQSSDPGVMYDVCGVLMAEAEVGGTVGLEILYV